jgi:hypothetical protein
MRNTLFTLLTTSTALLGVPALAQNAGEMPAKLREHLSDDQKTVWGGGAKEVSSYSGKIVPIVIDQLSSERLAGYNWGGPSEGTGMNAMKVTVNPTHLALGQADILQSLNGTQIPGTSWNYAFTVVQDDIADECLYMVTKSEYYTTWGHVLENAWDISISTGGEQSGSFGTLMGLQNRYPDLMDANITNVGGTVNIVQSVINGGESQFGFFVMRPDPENPIFEMINDNDLKLVPIIDFDIEDLYTFKSLKVSNSTWGGFGSEAKFHETACTKVQLITGDPKMLSPDQSKAKRRLEATIERASAIDGASFKEAVVGQFTSWKDYLDSVREIGGDKLDTMLKASKQKMDEMRN